MHATIYSTEQQQRVLHTQGLSGSDHRCWGCIPVRGAQLLTHQDAACLLVVCGQTGVDHHACVVRVCILKHFSFWGRQNTSTLLSR